MKRFLITMLFLVGGAILFQGFQCASPTMTTGRLAYQNQEWVKAKTNFEQELKKKPTNGEAWMYLADVEFNLGELENAQKALESAKKYKTEKISKDQLALIETKIWSKAYSNGYQYLVNFSENSERTDLVDSSLYYLNMAKDIRPENPEIRRIMGIAYESGKKPEEAMAENIKFTELMKPSMDFAIEKGLYIGQPIMEAGPKLGNPIDGSPVASNNPEDTLLVLVFKDNQYETCLFLSAPKKEPKKFVIKGWAVNQPEYLSKEEKMQWREIYTTPYTALAEAYFNKADYTKSLENVLLVSQIEPSNQAVNDFIVSIYEKQGKTDEAFKEIKKLVDKYPKNQTYVHRYADLFTKYNKWDDAIANYEKAIALDPSGKTVPVAYQNIGVCYKNKAAEIQAKQKELAERNQRPLDPKEYEPFLKKSEESYLRALGNEDNKENFEIMYELADIYYVTEQENNLKDIVMRMESLENRIKSKDKDEQIKYYRNLLKIYDRSEREYQDKEFFKGFQAKFEKVTKAIEELTK